MNSVEFLDAVRERHAIPSYTKLGVFLDIQNGHISQYTTGKRKLSPKDCEKVADALSVDKGYVMASVQTERAKRTSEREAWLRLAQLAKKAQTAALTGFAVLTGLSVPSPAEAAYAVQCILCKIGRGGDPRPAAQARITSRPYNKPVLCDPGHAWPCQIALT